MKSVSKKAYAKINLHLDITGLLPNGYHSVNNVMQSVSLSDNVHVTTRSDSKFTLRCNKEEIPLGEDNLAIRAANAFCAATGARLGADIVIEKNIPMAAGLAGGSADAAAVLLAMNELADFSLGVDALCAIGASLGADVPFCTVGGTAFAQGKGDILQPFPPMPECTIVVACGGEGVSTPKAFSMLDEAYGNFASELFYAPHSLSPLTEALKSGQAGTVAKNMYNIFEQPVLAVRPVAANLRRIMLLSGALGAMMSGSGPSVFGIFETLDSALSACETIRKIGVTPHVCTPITR